MDTNHETGKNDNNNDNCLNNNPSNLTIDKTGNQSLDGYNNNLNNNEETYNLENNKNYVQNKYKGNNFYKKSNTINSNNINHNNKHNKLNNNNILNTTSDQQDIKIFNLKKKRQFGFFCSPSKPSTKGRNRKNNNQYPPYNHQNSSTSIQPPTKNLGETKLHLAIKKQSKVLICLLL